MTPVPVRSVVTTAMAGVFVASLSGVFAAPQVAAPAAPAAQPARPTAQPAPQPLASSGAQPQLAALTQYCATCHNDRVKTAGVSFANLTPESIGQHVDLFEKAVRKVRGRVMPPPGARQPDAATADALVAWLEQSLDRAQTQAHVPDRLVLHRLNRKEYTNAVRDLLAVDFDATEVLPADDVAEGYDNIAAALQVSPSFIEQYVIAARAVAVKAMGRSDARPGGWTFRAGPGSQLTHVPGLPLGTRGGILASVDLPSDGEYIVDIADMATHIWGNGMEFENPLVVTVDNAVVYETVIGGEEDMKLYDQVQNGALDRVNARLKNIRFQATAGPHKIGVAFKRRTFAESDDQLQMFTKGGGQDRLYRVNSFQVRGPFNPKGLSATPSRERIFVCQPGPGATAEAQAACAKTIISHAGAPRLPAAGHGRGRIRALRVLPGRREGGRVRRRHPQRRHRRAGQPLLPLPRRARAQGPAAGRHLHHQRSRAGVEPVVLPLEHDSGRRAAAGGRGREAEAARGPGAAGAPHARRPALGVAGGQLRPPVARHEAAGRNRARLGGLPLRVGPRRSARRLPHRADALCRQPLPRRPQRGRSADGKAHLPQRARGAALRHHRREGGAVPAGGAGAVRALGAARQGRRADGGGLSEPHLAGAARRLHPQAHSRRAAGATRRPTCRRSTRRTSARPRR